MIFLSVAHSSKSPGVVNENALLQEYMISQRASLACYRRLTGEHVACVLSDVGYLDDHEYSVVKPAMANATGAALALEIHCNGSVDFRANYSEVIHHEQSTVGREAAKCIAARFQAEFEDTFGWLCHGARPNLFGIDQHKDFWLERTKVPALIVEGIFLSNTEQAAWIAKLGAELYGVIVADGILNWLKGK